MKAPTINDITITVPNFLYVHIAVRMELCGRFTCGLTTTENLGNP
jgi:hypothetical protein